MGPHAEPVLAIRPVDEAGEKVLAPGRAEFHEGLQLECPLQVVPEGVVAHVSVLVESDASSEPRSNPTLRSALRGVSHAISWSFRTVSPAAASSKVSLGEGEEGETYVVGPGEGSFHPSNVVHADVALEDTVVVSFKTLTDPAESPDAVRNVYEETGRLEDS